MPPDSPGKQLFRIGEVSQLTGINPHVLRYWESEFQILAPNRRLSKQRLYRQADIDLILEIKHLLEEEKYTLSGIKQYLADKKKPPHPSAGHTTARRQAELEELLVEIRNELQAIKNILLS
ncbi:MAG: MerR family transcriptional regulator [Deltaproteobacteria bacterium]|nr:MerR family transcriptional regulator [Deltaproteobacteria bacterium]